MLRSGTSSISETFMNTSIGRINIFPLNNKTRPERVAEIKPMKIARTLMWISVKGCMPHPSCSVHIVGEYSLYELSSCSCLSVTLLRGLI